MSHQRILALDVGDKTCGIALSDPLGWTAQPLTTLRCQGVHDRKNLFSQLFTIIKDNEIKVIVVGLPLNMNGTEGPQAGKVRDFVKSFQKYLATHGEEAKTYAWVFWDERLSSVGAERALLEADLSRAKRKKVIDKMAAVFILQGYMASQPAGESHLE